MRNFQIIHNSFDTSSLLLSINTQQELWNQNTLRTEAEGTPHREIDDIWLRMNDVDKCMQSGAENVDRRESINYPALDKLPLAKRLILQLNSLVGGERIGRCFVSRMKPGCQIYPHVDIGDDLNVYYDNEQYYNRFHIVLQGLPGSIFKAGDEQVCMRSGEVWWFDGTKEHSVINNSADDRVHLVCDIRIL